jgi:hypothetical protein
MKKREHKSKKHRLHQTGSNVAPVEMVWTHVEFARALETAKQQGAKNLLNEALLALCMGIVTYFGHFWADARPFFVELWARIEAKDFPYTKREACDRIGLSVRWAEKIVAGTARPLGSRKNPVPEDWTNGDYFVAITHGAEKTLRPLIANGEQHRYQNIYKLVRQRFAEMRRIKHIDEIENTSPKTTEEMN